MPGPGMEFIGEEEVQEVLEVMRGGTSFGMGSHWARKWTPDFRARFINASRR